MATRIARTLGLLALCLPSLFLGSACSGGLGHRKVATISGEQAIPQGVTRVEIEFENGSVEVRRGAPQKAAFRGQIRRAADTEAALAQLEATGSDLTFAVDPAAPDLWRITGPERPKGDLGVLAVEVQIDLPGELAVSVRVRGSGNLTIDGRDAPIGLDCGRGDLRLEQTRGAAKLHTGRGNVIADDHSGDLDVLADVGDMQIFVREPGTRLRLVTGMGNLQCLLPPDAPFRVEARTQTGKLANGFGLPMERDGFSAWMIGQRGDGRTELVMHSGKGHLSLSHKVFD